MYSGRSKAETNEQEKPMTPGAPMFYRHFDAVRVITTYDVYYVNFDRLETMLMAFTDHSFREAVRVFTDLYPDVPSSDRWKYAMIAQQCIDYCVKP